MEFKQILDIIKTVSESSLSHFEWKDETKHVSLSLKKESTAAAPVSVQVPLQPVVTASPVVTTAPTVQEAPKENTPEDGKIIKSPLVGTFYQSSSPEKGPFVKVGDQVKKGDVLGIIEAMKLMNEIECEYDGVIKEILVENEQVVEYGQDLFRIG